VRFFRPSVQQRAGSSVCLGRSVREVVWGRVRMAMGKCSAWDYSDSVAVFCATLGVDAGPAGFAG